MDETRQLYFNTTKIAKRKVQLSQMKISKPPNYKKIHGNLILESAIIRLALS
jgi:hypothetical protein